MLKTGYLFPKRLLEFEILRLERPMCFTARRKLVGPTGYCPPVLVRDVAPITTIYGSSTSLVEEVLSQMMDNPFFNQTD